MNQETRKAGKDCFWFSRKSVSWVPGFLIIFSVCLAPRAVAGDAVVIGYNQDGIWTSVTYYRSATPKGGKDYKTQEQARESALRDLRRRSQYPAITTKVLSSSNSSGFVAVARGHDKDDRDFHAVGRGKTQAVADKKAFDLLNKAGASDEQKIVYRYFSYGGPNSPRRIVSRTGKQNKS